MASSGPRLSHQTLKVLKVIAQAPPGTVAGADIIRAAGLLSGTLYPILARLEGAGWLKSKWEVIDASEVGRPRRRLYSLTKVGKKKLTAVMAELGL